MHDSVRAQGAFSGAVGLGRGQWRTKVARLITLDAYVDGQALVKR